MSILIVLGANYKTPGSWRSQGVFSPKVFPLKSSLLISIASGRNGLKILDVTVLRLKRMPFNHDVFM